MDVDGWHPDPYGIHEERLFADGEPTPLVRDGGVGSLDAPPATHSRPASGHGTGPTKPMLALAALLITAGVVVGIVGITTVGGGTNAATTTTLNPLVQTLLHLPPRTTMIPPQHAAAAPPTSTLSSIERALAALPRTTTPPATTPPTTRPTPATTVAPRVTQPPKRSTPVTAAIVPATTLPLTTLATTVGQADLSWYLGYASVFNTLQTDIEKLDRALASTSPGLFADVDPYWQELSIDAKYAGSVPPVPDAGAQSKWASALADFGQGATDAIWGSAAAADGAASLPPIFNQGSALITTGTTQLDEALSSVESQAAATSVASRAQVRAWDQAHGAVVTTLQTDLSRLSAAFMSSGPSDYSSVEPSWQQLLSDAQGAMNLAPVPDRLIQSYWSTALNDLIQGSTDCLGSSEALPPSLFDQGVASIDSGTGSLTTATGAIQSLVG
jgi:hypothetical protein